MISPKDCNVFIQVWVDSNAIQNGSTNGVYLVDNYLNNGSTKEGTTTLNSNVTTNSKICWTLLNVNVNSDVELSFQNFGNASIWGAGGVPQPTNNPNQWTGQAQSNGNASYEITFNVETPGAAGTTVTVSPSMTVHS